MADLTPTSSWAGIYQLETTDYVEGGAGKKANEPHQDLANRIEYLKDVVKQTQNYKYFKYVNMPASNTSKKVFEVDASSSLINFDFVVVINSTSLYHLRVELSRDGSNNPTGILKKIGSSCNQDTLGLFFTTKIICDASNLKIEGYITYGVGSVSVSNLEIFCFNNIKQDDIYGSFIELHNGLNDITQVDVGNVASLFGTSILHMSLGINIYDESYLLVSTPTTSDPQLNHSQVARNINTTPDYMPVGTVVMWYGDEINVPNKWHICDGSNGTPDLRGKFIRGATVDGDVGATGGYDSQQATFTTNVDGSHSHSGSTTGYTGIYYHSNTSGSAVDVAGHSHGHEFSTDVGGNHQHSGTTNPFNNKPAYCMLYYIMKITA